MRTLTVQEFNEKYKDYIEEGHYGLAISNEEVIRVLDVIFTEILTKVPDFKFSQIKTKFGICCFYSSLGHGHQTVMIEQYINYIIKKSKK